MSSPITFEEFEKIVTGEASATNERALDSLILPLVWAIHREFPREDHDVNIDPFLHAVNDADEEVDANRRFVAKRVILLTLISFPEHRSVVREIKEFVDKSCTSTERGRTVMNRLEEMTRRLIHGVGVNEYAKECVTIFQTT